MRDGRFASWENIVSRFQISPPWKKRKLTHDSESTQHSTKLKHCELKCWKSTVSYWLFFWSYICISLALGNHFGEYCGLTKIPKSDVVAKDPQACKTVISHVNCGSREGYKSQYISTTASYDVALRYKAKGEEKGLTELRIAEIDLDDLPETCKLEIVDLTTEENRDKYLGNAVCKNFAKASCEVLLKCNVPIPCHVVEEENVFERLFRAMNFIPI